MSAECAARPSQSIQPASTNKKDTLCYGEPLTDASHPGYQSFNEPFLRHNPKNNYDVPYDKRGTERVKGWPDDITQTCLR